MSTLGDATTRPSSALGGHGWNEQAIIECAGLSATGARTRQQFRAGACAPRPSIGGGAKLGLVERSAERTQEALGAAEMAIADDPGSSEVLGYAGCAISDLGHLDRGAEILRQAFEMDPSNAQAEAALGAALATLGDLDAGIARLRHGIKLSPRDRRLALWGWLLGSFLLRANRAEEALEEARIAARRDPRFHLPLILEAVDAGDAGADRTRSGGADVCEANPTETYAAGDRNLIWPARG